MASNVVSGQSPGASVRTSPPIVSYRKEPQINWAKLGADLEEQSQINVRSWGKRITYLSVPIGVGAVFCSYQGIKGVRPLSLLALASFVGGSVLWFWNLPDDEKALLEKREDVRDKIRRKIPLKEIQDAYPDPRVFSHHEIDQWLMYLLETRTFNEFMSYQNNTLPQLKEDSPAIPLIKKRYLYYARHPSNPSNIDSYSALFQTFLSPAESLALSTIRRKRDEELSGTASESYGKHFKQFMDRNGVEGLKALPKDQLLLYSWLFTLHVWERKIGIVAIEAEYQEVLSVFEESIRKDLFQAVAERDAAEIDNYDLFIKRNETGGIQSIENPAVKQILYDKFIHYIENLDIGWVPTSQKFGKDIQAFGLEYTQGLKQKMLQKDWNRFAQWDYQVFRGRVGIDQIQLQNDQAILPELRKKFLQLPIADLVKKVFAEDRQKLNVTDQDIKIALQQKWAKLSLKEILAQDRETFIYSISGIPPLMDPANWSEEAAKDVKGLPLKTVIDNYEDLIKHGILSGESLNFAVVLEKMDVNELSTLIEQPTVLNSKVSYGWVIFEHRLISPLHPKVFYLLACHISEHDITYIEGKTDSSTEIGKLMACYGLMPPVCTEILKAHHVDMGAEKQEHERRLGEIRQRDVERQRDAHSRSAQAVTRLTRDHEEARRALAAAEVELTQELERLKACDGVLERLNGSEKEAIEEEKKTEKKINHVRESKEELDKILIRLRKLEQDKTQKKQEYADKKVELENEKKGSSEYRKQQRTIEEKQAELAEITTHLELLQQLNSEIGVLKKIINGEETPENVTKKTPAEAKEKLDWITRAFTQEQNHIDLVEKKKSQLMSVIETATAKLEVLGRVDLTGWSISRIDKRIQEIKEETAQSVARQKELEAICSGLNALEEELALQKAKIESIRSEIEATKTNIRPEIKKYCEEKKESKNQKRDKLQEFDRGSSDKKEELNRSCTTEIAASKETRTQEEAAEETRNSEACKRLKEKTQQKLKKAIPPKPR